MRSPVVRTSTAGLCFALLVGCGASPSAGTAGGAATSSPSATSPMPSPDPVQTCVRQVTYWVGESLRAAPDQGFDYQHMGLSGATYDVVRAVTREARAASGDVDALVARRALEACHALKGPGATPTDGAGTGWP